MAWTAFHLANSFYFATSTCYQWTRWFIWGSDESHMADTTNRTLQKVNRLEKNINQMWAIQHGLLKEPTTQELDDVVILSDREKDREKDRDKDKEREKEKKA
jgi:hypothetical protein